MCSFHFKVFWFYRCQVNFIWNCCPLPFGRKLDSAPCFLTRNYCRYLNLRLKSRGSWCMCRQTVLCNLDVQCRDFLHGLFQVLIYFLRYQMLLNRWKCPLPIDYKVNSDLESTLNVQLFLSAFDLASCLWKQLMSVGSGSLRHQDLWCCYCLMLNLDAHVTCFCVMVDHFYIYF